MLQVLVLPSGPPGLGRATAKTAMEAAKKRAILENMVKMRVGFVGSELLRDKDEVGYSN